MRNRPVFVALLVVGVFGAFWKFHWGVEGARQTPDPLAAAVHGPSCGDSCAHVAGPVARQEIELASLDECFAGEPGAWKDLGFRVGGMSRGQVTMRQRKPDGREVIALLLPNGDDLFMARSGEEWEGRVISKSGGNGWRIRGEGLAAVVEEMEHGALVCSRKSPGGVELGGIPPVDEPLVEQAQVPEVGEALVILNSLPGANGVIYLDFDGETVEGTQWNSSYNGGDPIIAAASPFNAAQIEEIWMGVSEDYRPFNVNITTDRAVFDATPVNRRMMVIVTPSNEWYGSSGGVAYVDVFGSSSFDAPAWVFSDRLANSPKYCAEAASHEAGHTLGLRHDGTSTQGYYEGHGSGATSWAPIMGVGYYSTVTQWSRGEYPDADRTEDDLAIISKTYNGLGYRDDDHGGGTGSSTPMTETGPGQIASVGVIETNTDVDVFSFQTSGGAVDLWVDNFDYDPNLDVRMRLLNGSGSELMVSDPEASLDASISASLSAGTYYVEVTGVGTGDLVTGYGDYGSLGEYYVTGTVPLDLELAAEITSPAESQVAVAEGTGLILESFVSVGSASWEVVSAPSGGSATFSDPLADTTEVVFSQPGTYLLRLKGTWDTEEVTDDLEVSVDPLGAPSGFPVQVAGIDLGGDRDVYSDRLLLEPVIIDDGAPGSRSYDWVILSGPGTLSDTGIESPELVFSAGDQPVALRLTVDDGTCRSFAEVVLTARFQQVVLIDGGASARALVPGDGSLGVSWQQPGFDDSTWRSGNLGVGYDVSNGPSSNRIFLPLIGSGMDVGAEMYEQRPGCYVRVPFELVNPNGALSVVLRVNYDDGFVAYLNGVEVARSNVPGGSPSWNTVASSDRNDSSALSAVTYQVAVPDGVLVAGTNVLSLHGMNSGTGKGERNFILAAELEATVADVPMSPFQVAVQSISDPSLQDPEDDADGDGRSNLYEHGAATSLVDVDEGYRVLEVLGETSAMLILPELAPDDVRYTLEHTSDLRNPWSGIAERVGAGAWSGIFPDSTTPLPDGRVGFTFSTPDGAGGFFRMKMELLMP